jgi:DNA-binding IclR family transcriptional regulator
MKDLDKILELMRDSNWHSLEELRKEITLPSEKLDNVLSFLQEQGFVDKEDEKLRITPAGLRLLELPA